MMQLVDTQSELSISSAAFSTPLLTELGFLSGMTKFKDKKIKCSGKLLQKQILAFEG